jgi:hypothetical protein
VLLNKYYSIAYDGDNIQPPDCYAFGRDEKKLAPHEVAGKKQCEFCANCAKNQFGSAAQGRGKACSNRRKLALVEAGTLLNRKFKAYDKEELERANVGYLEIPPTSINTWGAYVKQVACVIKRGPQTVYTKISLVPDNKTQFRVCFELVGPIPDKLIETALQHSEKAKESIIVAWPVIEVEAQTTKKQKKY